MCHPQTSLSASPHGRLLVFFSSSCVFFAISFIVLLINLINYDSKCSGSVTTGMYIYGGLAFYFAFIALIEFFAGFVIIRKRQEIKERTMSLFVAITSGISFLLCTVAALVCTIELFFRADLSCLYGGRHGEFYILALLLGLAVIANLGFFVMGAYYAFERADETSQNSSSRNSAQQSFVYTISTESLEKKEIV